MAQRQEELGGVRNPSEMPSAQRTILWVAVAIQLVLLGSVLWQVWVALSNI